MKKFFFKSNLSLIQKICLSGLFIALTTICQKVVAINYIPVVPFVRVSLCGPALIIFSSILMGPWFGLLVGTASDVLGYFIFDASGFPLYPQITAIYSLLGFASYFVFCLVRFIKNDKLILGIEFGVFAALLTFIITYVFTHNSIKLYSSTYTIDMAFRIGVTVALIAFTAVLVVSILLINRFFKKKDSIFSPISISFACFISEILVMVLFGCLMKGLSFGFGTYPAILASQVIVMFFNVPLNTITISLLSRFVKRYYEA